MNKIKYLIPILLAILIGIYFGNIIYKNYKNNTEKVFGETENNVFFLQQGVYSSLESLEENTKILTDYIYVLDNNTYRVFVGISSNLDVANKIKTVYNDKGINIYIKDINISNSAFVEKLKEYDKSIIDTDDINQILNMQNQIMKEYEILMKN